MNRIFPKIRSKTTCDFVERCLHRRDRRCTGDKPMRLTPNISAVITGGASGLGRAGARAMAASGAKVAIFDMVRDKGEEIAHELDGVFCHVDVTNEQSVIDGFAKARDAHGQERILLHCAHCE